MQEKDLVGYILKCCNHYFGLSIVELRELAFEFAVKIGIEYPSPWEENKMAGRSWYYAFMKRHQQLSLRTPEQTSYNRVRAFCKENVQSFFNNLDGVLTENPFPPQSIWNMDETGFSTVPSKIGKVISLKGMRRVGLMASQERGKLI